MIKTAIALLFFTGCTFAENENHLREFSKVEERANSTINQLAKKYNLGVATIYRIMAEMKG